MAAMVRQILRWVDPRRLLLETTSKDETRCISRSGVQSRACIRRIAQGSDPLSARPVLDEDLQNCVDVIRQAIAEIKQERRQRQRKGKIVTLSLTGHVNPPPKGQNKNENIC